MTQKERSEKFYRNRKGNGLCPRCGKKLDREGHYCIECLEKIREYHRANREFCRKLGICPECGKEKLFGIEKQCILCREKKNERRKKETEEQKKRYKENFKKRQREVYKERSEKGICTKCGKRKAFQNRKKCGICLEKDREIQRKVREKRGNKDEYKRKNNLCHYCMKPIDRENGKLCNECWLKCVENGRKSTGNNDYWKFDNKMVFRSF